MSHTQDLILSHLRQCPSGATRKEIAKSLGMNYNTIQHCMLGLKKCGLVDYDAKYRWRAI